MSKYEIELNWDLAHANITKGDHLIIEDGSDHDYVTTFFFILPLSDEEIKLGRYKFSYKSSDCELIVSIIRDEHSDPLFQEMGNHKLSSGLHRKPDLTYHDFSDNKGAYPCYLASLIIHSRINLNPLPGGKDDEKYKEQMERARILGVPDDENKIFALSALNFLLKSDQYPKKIVESVTDEKVTNYIQSYFLKKNKQTPVLVRNCTFTSKSAFRNATLETTFKGDYKTFFAALAGIPLKTHFNSEEDLYEFVLEAIDRILVHHIENRRWIEPFWDGERKIKKDGVEQIIPARPKHEPKIQPTFDVIFHEAFERHGIAVFRESDEGIGSLDFCFSCTSKEGDVLRTNLELKLAHHKKLKHGISIQLPAYMRANKCAFGIFIILWFKDEKSQYFTKPSDYTISESREFLEMTAQNIFKKNNLTIGVRVIDSSIRPSASTIT